MSDSVRHVTQRRAYDVEELHKLCIGDLNVELHPYEMSEPAQEKIKYWLARAWDSGWAHGEKR